MQVIIDTLQNKLFSFLVFLINNKYFFKLGGHFRPRPHVSVFVKKTQLFVAVTASVHTYPMKTVIVNAAFLKRSPEWNYLKTPFSCFRVDEGKGNFSKGGGKGTFHISIGSIKNGGKTELFISVSDPAYPRERKWRDVVILRFCFAQSAMKYTRMDSKCKKHVQLINQSIQDAKSTCKDIVIMLRDKRMKKNVGVLGLA